MRRRPNPWPAYADLFCALLVATFAGFIMLSAAYQDVLGRYQRAEKESTKMREEANGIVTKIQEALNQDKALGGHVRRCGEDTCIDMYIHFEENKDLIINANEHTSLDKWCSTIKDAIDQLSPERRRDIEITIEGHTDRQQASGISDPRDRYLYNWNLSAKRASSVLYTFQQCGLKPPDYQIVPIGYAESMPLCTDSTSGCFAENRRTTLRLRADTKRIEERLKDAK